MHDFARPKQQQTKYRTIPGLSWVWRLVVGIALGGLIFFGLIFSFVFILSLGSKLKESGSKSLVWILDGKDPVSKELLVLWVSPSSKIIKLITLDPEAKIQTSGSGSYPARSLFGFYELNKVSNRNFLRTLVKSISVDLQGLVVIRRQSSESLFGLLMNSFLRGDAHNISRADLCWLFWISMIGGYDTESESWPQEAKQTYPNTLVAEESVTIALVNASGEAKVASSYSHLFSSLGAKIVSVTDTVNRNRQSRIFVEDEALSHSETIKMLRRYLSAEVAVDAKIADQYRSGLVVLIGSDDAAEF